MTSILFVTVVISRNYVKCNYLRKQKPFLNFFCPFSKSASKSKHFEEKDDSHSVGIFDITDCE